MPAGSKFGPLLRDVAIVVRAATCYNIRAVILSTCLVPCSLSLIARAQDVPAQDVRQFTDGPSLRRTG